MRYGKGFIWRKEDRVNNVMRLSNDFISCKSALNRWFGCVINASAHNSPPTATMIYWQKKEILTITKCRLFRSNICRLLLLGINYSKWEHILIISLLTPALTCLCKQYYSLTGFVLFWQPTTVNVWRFEFKWGNSTLYMYIKESNR